MNKHIHFTNRITSILAFMALTVFILMPGRGWGQTNPTAQALPFTQNFGTSTFTTMPTGMAAWNGLNGGNITTQALAEASSPSGDASITIATASTTTGGTFGYAVSSNARPYVQTSSNSSNGVNQLALAINTTGKTNIVVAYDVEIINNSPRTVGIVMQYRNGTSGAWTTVTGTGNPFSQAGGTTGVKANASVTLPVAAENQAVVQIRWATWRGTESGNSSGIAIDNISVTGSAVSCVDPTTQASAVSFSNIVSDQMTVGWTRGGTPGDGVIVVAKAGSTPDDPADGTSYTANAAFGTGTQIGTGTYVVFYGSGTTVNVTGLIASTTYYYKVYEKNCTGTSIKINTTSPAEGNQATTAACAENPTITTTIAVNTIATTTASSGGAGLASGANCTITAKGVCWNTSTSPTIANSKTTDGSGTADFTSSLTGLSAQTLYYVRAYATNGFSTNYGPEVTFRTLSLEPTTNPSNLTGTAVSSSQINLSFSAASTITYAKGYLILRRTGTSNNPTFNNVVDGVAPASLSLPSGTTLVADINSTSTTTYNNTGLSEPNTQYNYALVAYNWDGANPATYNYYTGGTIKVINATTLPLAMTLPYTQTFEGSASEWVLASTGTNKWAIGTATANGGTKGLYISNDGGTSNAYTITSSQSGTDASVRVDLTGITAASLSFDWKSNGESDLDYGEVYINTGASDVLISGAKEFQLTSVFANKRISLTPYVGGIVTIKFRWVNDGSVGTIPPFAVDNVSVTAGDFAALTTTAVNSIAVNSASSGGNITNDGGSTVTARGVCYGTTPAPSTAGTKTVDGTGTGSFTSTLTGLADNTLYYVRAYATNSTGTAYGNEVSFTTSTVSAPIVTSATSVGSNSFSANWGAVTGATGGYLLDVSTSPTFGTGTPATLTEGFENGLSSSGYVSSTLGLSSGTWTFVDGGLRNTDKYSGTYSCQLKATTGTATTPALSNVGTLTFYAKAPTGASTLIIKKIVNSVTTTIDTKNITTSWAQYSVNVNDNSSAVQIVFASGSPFILLDDVSISYTSVIPSFVSDYNAKTIAGQATVTSTVTGLAGNTTYYYRLRAVGSNSTSANSNPPITVLTAPSAYAVSGSGAYCQGSGGLAVGVGSSEIGVTYNITPGGETTSGTGGSITFGNRLAGTYTISGTNAGGTTAMTGSAVITENSSSTVETTESACESYTWALNGVTYTTSGDKTYVVGCVTNILHLTITPSSTVETTESACDTYTWNINGVTYNASGDYTYIVGCVTNILHLTITPSSTVEATASACDSYTWAVNGVTYNASGNYTYVVGCVTNTLYLTITPSSTVETTASACDSYTWALNGVTYTTSGDKTYVDGCVTNILHLTITPSSTVEATASACDTYTWALNGVTYTTSGDKTYVDGCVTNILHLTITPSSTVEATASACDTYTWALNGVTYTTSGDKTYVDGCVSNILHLTITPSVVPTFTQLGPYCVGATPGTLPLASNNGIVGTWNAAISTATAGTTTYHFTPAGGQCASATTMDIVVNAAPTANAGIGVGVGQGVPYTLSGSATNYSSVEWTIEPGGSSENGIFDDAAKLNAKFTGNTLGTINLRLTATGGCGVASSDITMVVLPTEPVNWKGTAANNNWNNPDNWFSASVPDENTDVYIPANAPKFPTVTATAACRDIEIAAGASLIDNGNYLTVHGTATVNHTAIAPSRWHLISSPVSNAKSGMYTGQYLRNFITSTGKYEPVYSTTEVLTPAKGFALWTTASNSTAYVGSTLNSGTQSFTLSSAGDRWNLVGNPYPSSIDWSIAGGFDKSNIDNAIYVVNEAGWNTYVNGVSTPETFSPEIAPTQGFFVRAKTGATGTLQINNNARVHSNTPFYKHSEAAVPNLVRLKVSGNGYADEAVVRFKPEATADFDGDYDAVKMFGDVAAAAQLYSLGTTPLAINSLPETELVSVGIHVGTAGSYTIEATEINDLNYVTLEDAVTGIFTPLSGNSYTFDAAPGDFDNRFKLHFSMLSVDEAQKASAAIYSYQHTIYINMKDQQKGDIFVYNISGQLVKTIPSARGNNEIKVAVGGNYIVKVVGKDNTSVKKVWIQQ